MLSIRLLCIGKIKEPSMKDAVALYEERVGHLCNFEIVELPASREKEPARYRSDETTRIRHNLQQVEGNVWVLDETGKDLTSIQFAEELSKAHDQALSLTFVLGGAYGIDLQELERPYRLLRLSAMTFPHELCRVVFLEQLYRGLQIGRGSGYHH